MVPVLIPTADSSCRQCANRVYCTEVRTRPAAGSDICSQSGGDGEERGNRRLSRCMSHVIVGGGYTIPWFNPDACRFPTESSMPYGTTNRKDMAWRIKPFIACTARPVASDSPAAGEYQHPRHTRSALPMGAGRGALRSPRPVSRRGWSDHDRRHRHTHLSSRTTRRHRLRPRAGWIPPRRIGRGRITAWRPSHVRVHFPVDGFDRPRDRLAGNGNRSGNEEKGRHVAIAGADSI